ncbi:MAG: hypothetical protein ACOCW2_03045, partial [Chitinivibrionales bacterium]
MKSFLKITAVVISVSLSAKSENFALQSAAHLGTGYPSFSATDYYNAASHAGSPLGLLDADSMMLQVDLSFRFHKTTYGADDQFRKQRSFSAPHVRLAHPGTIVFDLSYTPDL